MSSEQYGHLQNAPSNVARNAHAGRPYTPSALGNGSNDRQLAINRPGCGALLGCGEAGRLTSVVLRLIHEACTGEAVEALCNHAGVQPSAREHVPC